MGQPLIPFWGPPTSYLNFCEEDYVITRYIAEFINTASSLVFVAYGIYGLAGASGFRPGAREISYYGLMGVGICSAAYHMTLKYHTQMSDELSMHLLTTPLIYRLLTFNATPQRTKVIGAVLLSLFTIVMVTHMVMDEFLLHATSFGLGVYIIASRTISLIPQQVQDPQKQRALKTIAITGCCCFGFGYFFWLVDDWACSLLTSTRHTVGLPLAFLLELHGWWHVLTAIGGYIGVVLVDMLISGKIPQDPTSAFAWPVPPAIKFITATKK